MLYKLKNLLLDYIKQIINRKRNEIQKCSVCISKSIMGRNVEKTFETSDVKEIRNEK